MLFGFHEDGMTFKTIVFSATSEREFDQLTPDLFSGVDGFISSDEAELADMLDKYHGFIKYPLIVELRTKSERDAFDDKFGVEIGKYETMADVIIQQKKMVDFIEEPDGPEERTIAEIYDIQDYDPHDHLTEEERELLKKKFDKAKKNNSLSGDDSFSPQVNKDGKVIVTDVRTEQNADGSVSVKDVLGVKMGVGPESDNEFFIGNGENHFHKLEVYGLKLADIEKTIPLNRSKVSKDSDFGCWVAYVAEKSGKNAMEYLNDAGIFSARVYVSDGEGNEIIPEDVVAVDVDSPRPWNIRSGELASMTEDELKKNKKSYKAGEFCYSASYYNGRGTIIHITPLAYFENKNEMWPKPLDIGNMLPRDDFEEIEPGVYLSKMRDEDAVIHLLGTKGFIDNMYLRLYLNALAQES